MEGLLALHALSRGRRAWAWSGAALVALIAAEVVVRWPGFTVGGFASHDVGGILYNGMLLRAGGLPYVDSVELKAPGSFYLAALLAGPEGRDIAAFQVWANGWALASLAAVWALAGALWGPRAAAVAAAIYALGDAFLDSMDANYVTWAQLPQIAAVGLALAASRASGRAALGRWAAAGALAGAAALCKQPTGIVLLPVLGWALASGPGPGLRGGARAGAAALAGFAAAHAPIAAHYLARGRLSELVGSYVASPWGVRYVGHRMAEETATSALREWALASAHFLALPLALAAFAGLPRAERRRGSPAPWLWVWALAGLCGAAVGLRFFKGYFLAAAPALAILAAAPWGALGGGRRSWARALALAVAAVLALRAGHMTMETRRDRARPHDAGAQAIARHVAASTREGERIWVWGWHLWGVYALSGRLAGSRVYKSLGLLTPPEVGTWRRPAPRLTLDRGSPYLDVVVGDLEASRPAFIVLGSTVPRGDFTALRQFLARSYERDRSITIGKVEIWRRRG